MDVNKFTNIIERTDVVAMYLHDIARIPEMTMDEEKSLFAEVEASKKRMEYARKHSDINCMKREEDFIAKLRAEVISRHQRFCFAVAKKYNSGKNIMDLVNEGTIGMQEAFDTYELSKNVRFCSYAVWFIRRKINAYLVKENLTVRSTVAIKVVPKVKKFENKFFAINGRMPSETEIIEYLDKEHNIKVNNRVDLHPLSINSINASITQDEDDAPYENSSEFAIKTASENSYEVSMEKDSLSYSLNMALSQLTDRERYIISRSAGLGVPRPLKDAEIGEELNLTSERVRQIRIATQKKMRQLLAQVSA